jgi:hypothetical protein
LAQMFRVRIRHVALYAGSAWQIHSEVVITRRHFSLSV